MSAAVARSSAASGNGSASTTKPRRRTYRGRDTLPFELTAAGDPPTFDVSAVPAGGALVSELTVAGGPLTLELTVVSAGGALASGLVAISAGWAQKRRPCKTFLAAGSEITVDLLDGQVALGRVPAAGAVTGVAEARAAAGMATAAATEHSET